MIKWIFVFFFSSQSHMEASYVPDSICFVERGQKNKPKSLWKRQCESE